MAPPGMAHASVPFSECISCLDVHHAGTRIECHTFSKLPSSFLRPMSRQQPGRGKFQSKWKPLTVSCSSSAEAPKEGSDSQFDGEDRRWENFSIIEGRDTVQDFAKMQMQEIVDNIARRRDKIFLLMEEVRRLRIQQRIKSQEAGAESLQEQEQSVPSAIPFLPPLVAVYGQTSQTLKQYYVTFITLVTIIILFGGLVAPTLELKLGLGGTSYADFIRNVHLPMQLSQVDPIVASFSGGAVGVLSALLIVEIKNVEMQEQRRWCRYSCGTGASLSSGMRSVCCLFGRLVTGL
eukprot:TRINITY_DN3338_c0_g3_i4.p1 TRINITY_DN3338_c0_g3~~TRINITY_DN3338_c0_g3_i4.p1  ORF type:complete len:310 (-),score=35.41 TRINITY_DN3338_c0_g3_i4:1754-2629(-)